MAVSVDNCVDAQRLWLLAQGDNRPLPAVTPDATPPASAPRHGVEVRPMGSTWQLSTNYATLLDKYYKGELKDLYWYRVDGTVASMPLVVFGAMGFVFAGVLPDTMLHAFTVPTNGTVSYSSYAIGGGGGVTPEYVDNAVAAEAALRIAADADLQWQIDNIHIDVPIDPELDLESTNPVENRVVTGAVNSKQDQIPQEQLDEMTDQEIDDLIASLV